METLPLKPLYRRDDSSGWNGGRESWFPIPEVEDRNEIEDRRHPDPSSTESYYIIGCEMFGVVIE